MLRGLLLVDFNNYEMNLRWAMSEMRSSSVRRVSSSMSSSSSSSSSASIGASKSSEKSMKPTPAGAEDPFVVCPFVLFPFVGNVPLLVMFSTPVPTATVVLVAPPWSFLLPRRSGMATFAALSGLRMVPS